MQADEKSLTAYSDLLNQTMAYKDKIVSISRQYRLSNKVSIKH